MSHLARAALAAVDGIVAAEDADPATRRAAICLLRLAVEASVDAVWWAAGRREVSTASRRAQFLVLPQFRDPGTATAAAALWSSLSAAGHHHAYELTPTAAEIADWRDATAVCLAALTGSDGHQSSVAL